MKPPDVLKPLVDLLSNLSPLLDRHLRAYIATVIMVLIVCFSLVGMLFLTEWILKESPRASILQWSVFGFLLFSLSCLAVLILAAVVFVLGRQSR